MIRIVIAVVRDTAGRVLMVRKRGTAIFMLPGGKPGEGEGALAALSRELVEELGCAPSGEPALLGRFTAPAANEPDHLVEAIAYSAILAGEPLACAEIAELAWHDPTGDAAFPIARLALEHVLPAACAEAKAA